MLNPRTLEAMRVLEERILHSLLAERHGRIEDPNYAAANEHADEGIVLAARDLVDAINAAHPEEWPVGWKRDGSDERYLIWSHHHSAWWGPNTNGYRRNVNDAGRYTLAQAEKELRRGCRCCRVPEVLVHADLTAGAGDRDLVRLIAVATDVAVAQGSINPHYEGDKTAEASA